MIALFFISFIPVIGIVSTPLLFMISAYYYGFSNVDYSVERMQLSYREGLKFHRTHRGLLLGNGIPFALILIIPFIGVIIATFFSIVSSVAATIAVVENSKKETKNIV